MRQTMSISKGEVASHAHNFDLEHRAKLDNVDASRSSENVVICDTRIREFYAETFGAAMEAYNEKQVAAGHPERQIRDYYEKLCHGKQERPMNEMVVQIGNRDTMPADDADCRAVSREILKEFADRFKKKYPNFLVAQAVIHMDEATPHLHMVYVPVTHKNKRGMETRVSLRGALRASGFTDVRDWNKEVFELLESVSQEHGIERLDGRSSGRWRMSVREFKAAINEPDYPYRNDPELLCLLDEQQALLEECHETVTQMGESLEEFAEAKISVSQMGALRTMQGRAQAVCRDTKTWRDGLRAAVDAFAAFLDAVPELWREHVVNPISAAFKGMVEAWDEREYEDEISGSFEQAVSVSHGMERAQKPPRPDREATPGANAPKGASEGR